MRILNYIKGDTRGSACRDIERRSLSDPFLSDAIDGYEICAGRGAEHIRSIAELEHSIYHRRTTVKRQWPLLVFISIMLVILCTAILVFFAM